MADPAAPPPPLLALGLPALGGLALGLVGALVIGLVLAPEASSGGSGPEPGATAVAADEVTAERLAAIEFTAEDLTRMIWDEGDNGGLLLPHPDPVLRRAAAYGASMPEDVIAAEAGEFDKALTEHCIVIDKGSGAATAAGSPADAAFVAQYWDTEAWAGRYPGLALAVESGRAYPSVEAAEVAMEELRRMRADCAEFSHEYGEVPGGLRYTRVGTIALEEIAFPIAVPEPVDVLAWQRRGVDGTVVAEHYVMRLGNALVGVDFRPTVDNRDEPAALSREQRRALLPAVLQEQVDRMLWWAAFKIESGAA